MVGWFLNTLYLDEVTHESRLETAIPNLLGTFFGTIREYLRRCNPILPEPPRPLPLADTVSSYYFNPNYIPLNEACRLSIVLIADSEIWFI